MPPADLEDQPRRCTLVLVGGVAGDLIGTISGPITMLAFILLDHYLYGGFPPLIVLFVSPIIGAILGALEGLVIGVIWPLTARRRHRLTIAQLMLVVAISGPGLALNLYWPSFALLILGNALLVLPGVTAALIATVRRHERSRRSAGER